MRPPDIDGLAAELVPGIGSAVVEHLGRGLYYDAYRVTRDATRYILKAARQPGSDLGLAWEASLLESASARGLAPPVVHVDAARGLLLYRWVDGRTPPAQELQAANGMAAIAALIRSVQSLPVPPEPRRMRPVDWLEHYRQALQAAEMGVDAELWRCAHMHLAALVELPGHGDTVAHSDLHRLNVLEAQGGLMLLDWEYAHLTESLWDVAGWVANNDFGAERAAAFLQAYLERPATPDERRRLEHLTWLYDYVCLLWCTLFLAADAACGTAELKKRRHLLQTRLGGVRRLWQTSAKPTES